MSASRHPAGDLERAIRLLRSRLWQLALCVILGAGAAAVLSATQAKSYSASASLLFRDPQLDQKLFGSTFFAGATDPAREAATNLALVSLDTVYARAARSFGTPLTAADVGRKVHVAEDGQSDLASITAEDGNPKFAARLANAVARQYILFRVEADRSKIGQASDLVQRQYSALSPQQRRGIQGRSLQERAEQLRIFAALQTGNAELVQPAQPPSDPSSPRPRRNALFGGMVGLLVGLGLILLVERWDRRVQTLEELEQTLDLPLLATIPQSRALQGQLMPASSQTHSELEPFRMLRARLRFFNIDKEIRSVLVTSAAPGDGKTTVAANLAIAASGGARVVLVEADLRRPTLAARLALSEAPGLADALTNPHIQLDDVLRPVELGRHAPGDPTAPSRLSVITAGTPPPNPAELLDSAKMEELLQTLMETYDFVVVDTPPTSVVSDALPLIQRVDGVVVVARLGRSNRDDLRSMRQTLEQLDANVLGVVPNTVRTGGHGYGYGYGYGAPVATPQATNVRSSA